MANKASIPFRGFFIQARTMADNSSAGVGTFVTGTNSRVACSNVSRVTAQHGY